MAGADFHLAEQQLRGLAVRQLVRQLHRLGAAGDQAGDEGLLQQVLVVGARGEGAQELRRGGLRIRLRQAKRPTRNSPNTPDAALTWRGAGGPAGGRIRGGTGGRREIARRKCAANAAECCIRTIYFKLPGKSCGFERRRCRSDRRQDDNFYMPPG